MLTTNYKLRKVASNKNQILNNKKRNRKMVNKARKLKNLIKLQLLQKSLMRK